LFIALILAVLFSTAANPEVPHKRTDRIDDAAAKGFIIERFGCEGEEHALAIYTIEHVDLTRDGRDNLLVVASTCMTGTAGPDVHDVLSRDDDGDLVSLPIQRAQMPSRRMLFGNPNSFEHVEGGELVSVYNDTSGRKAPLVIRYRWNGKEFRQTGMVSAKPFPTSFNCERANEEVEQAICANEKVAQLDRELNMVYLRRLRSASADHQQKLRNEQRTWIRSRNQECGNIYKGWVECLTDMYAKRIGQLK
jgi:uncharacterized protein YecT (DUF1311 family)